MSNHFWIQASHPRWHTPARLEETTLDEAVEAVFPRETEDAFVVWQHVYIPMSYKYDVGTILPDVLRIVNELHASTSGEYQVDWPSNTFAARWQMKWAREELVVTCSEWRSVVGDTEELLRERPAIEIGKAEFVFEWKALLERVRDALVGAGYTHSMLPELQWLAETADKIAERGVLYR